MKRQIAALLLSLLLLSGCGKTTTVKLAEQEKESLPALQTAPQTAPQMPETLPVQTQAATQPTEMPRTEPSVVQTEAPEPAGKRYILNTNSKKIHDPACGAVKKMAAKNKKEFTGTLEELGQMGYVPCKICGGG